MTGSLNIVFAGHVDHGKSTIVGRLLSDTNSLPDGKLAQIGELCRRTSKPFEYAFLIDALKDERAQGITIDSARVFFTTAKRHYIIIDAPGHIEFLKNMVTGASRAGAAVLVIDASEGIRENSRRHGYMLSMLGIRQILVAVNKMDLVGYDRKTFERIEKEYAKFLRTLGLPQMRFIPVSGQNGDNIASRSAAMPWYDGPTLLEALDGFEDSKLPVDRPFRMPVQDVYKFTKFGDARRIVVGTVASGSVRTGDEIIFYPSGKKSRVRTVEAFNAEPPEGASCGEATGFTLDEQIYVRRGEIAAKSGEPRPFVTSRLKVSLFWMSGKPMSVGTQYILKNGTSRTPVEIEEIVSVIDAAGLEKVHETETIARHRVAECILKLSKAIAFDPAEENPETGRFVIVDEYEIAGGGIILKSLEDQQMNVRAKVLTRNIKWEKSTIPAEVRGERFNQKPMLIVLTGKKNSGKKVLARKLEEELYRAGKNVYFLGIGNVLYGVDADIKGIHDDRHEHIRRLAEVAHLMLDAGMILIVTAIELTQRELELIETTIASDSIFSVWVGEKSTSDIQTDLVIENPAAIEEALARLKSVIM